MWNPRVGGEKAATSAASKSNPFAGYKTILLKRSSPYSPYSLRQTGVPSRTVRVVLSLWLWVMTSATRTVAL